MITLLIGVITKAERLQPIKFIGIALAALGVFVAFSESLAENQRLPDDAITGDLLMIAAVILSAVFNVLSQRFIHRYSALTVTAVCMTSGSVILLFASTSFGLVSTVPELSVRDWSLLAFLCLGGALLGNLLWLFALGLTAPSRVAVFAMLPPIVVAILGAVLLGETPSILALSGLGLVLAGISISQFGPG